MMVWQQDVHCIVMLTNLSEAGDFFETNVLFAPVQNIISFAHAICKSLGLPRSQQVPSILAAHRQHPAHHGKLSVFVRTMPTE